MATGEPTMRNAVYIFYLISSAFYYDDYFCGYIAVNFVIEICLQAILWSVCSRMCVILSLFSGKWRGFQLLLQALRGAVVLLPIFVSAVLLSISTSVYFSCSFYVRLFILEYRPRFTCLWLRYLLSNI